MNKSQQVFFELIRAGLWEKEARISPFGEVDYSEVMRLSEEQSVMGLVTVGLEYVNNVKVPQEWLLQFIGQSLQIEQQNTSMNKFIGEIVSKMRGLGIYALIVKGQVIAQCYERPLWRASGDVDFFLSDDNYELAKGYFSGLASTIEDEKKRIQHIGMTIGSWSVELHGSLGGTLTKNINDVLDDIKKDTFYGGNVSSCYINGTQILKLSLENDIVYVFTHILQHFFKRGIGIRQICDWCRLLWVNRDRLNVQKLEKLIREMKLLTEWQAFASLAVNTLGMPAMAMPLYSDSPKWSRKANKILSYILETGNFGHNRDISYQTEKSTVVRKIITMWRQTKDSVRHFFLFPIDATKVWWNALFIGLGNIFNKDS